MIEIIKRHKVRPLTRIGANRAPTCQNIEVPKARHAGKPRGESGAFLLIQASFGRQLLNCVRENYFFFSSCSAISRWCLSAGRVFPAHALSSALSPPFE